MPTDKPWSWDDFVAANPTSSVSLRMDDGTFCGVDIYGEIMLDSVVLEDRAVVHRTPENLVRALRWKQPDDPAPGGLNFEELRERANAYARNHLSSDGAA